MNKTSTNLDIVKYIYNELEEPNKNKITIQSLIDDKTKSQIAVSYTHLTLPTILLV